MNDIITVTSPLIPPLEEFIPYLEDIWRRKWLTNNGYYHQELERALCELYQFIHEWYFTVDMRFASDAYYGGGYNYTL